MTRVIYAEAGTRKSDWYAVGKVIYNRMNDNRFSGNTAYDIVVANDQFSAYNSSTDYYNPDTTSAKWTECLNIASSLCNGNAPSSSGGITNQVYFRSVKTFINGYSSPDGTPQFNGDFVENVVMPDVGDIGAAGLSAYDFSNKYSGYVYLYNIYFNFSYK